MKKQLLLIAVGIIMNASLYSQSLLPVKTKYQGEDAVIISVAQMDRVAESILRLQLRTAQLNATQIELRISNTNIEKLNLEVNFLQSLNDTKNKQIALLGLELSGKDAQHELDLLYFKGKAQEKTSSFFLGFSIGAIVALVFGVVFG
ncbi:hypothetical protein ACFFVB_18390 [Formosa undariae]|uniref:Uncharacterized protein n=1 Tax=Formosa undariae TaxID=1325436 RepID=A0ABV5F6I0_9FLAO